jgi:hypothetical protein
MTQILESGQRKAVENRLAEVTKALNAIGFDKTPPEKLTPEQSALVKEREELWKQLDQVKTP